MTDSTLNNRRRLERHSRRDGNLQARARPVMVERNDDASSAAYIRNFVEKVQNEGMDFTKRLLTGTSSSDDGSSGDGTSNSGTTKSTGKGTSSSTEDGDSESDTTTSSTGRPGGFTSDDSTYSTSTRRDDGVESTTSSSTRSTSTRTSTTPTSTRSSTSTTPTSTRTSSSSSEILTTTAAVPTSTAAPTTSVAYVTAVTPSSTGNLAAASSTATSTSKGVGAGPIIGIVAGSLAGIAVIAVIVGFLFKKFGRKEDPYEADPFDRDSFRRHSAMLPDNFESDDGHPSMMEHNNMGPFSDQGYGAAAAAAVGGMAATSAYSHNESGGPRPPTMFQKHINGPGAQYAMNDGAAYYDPNDLTPQLPPMAFGGSDPYSMAGVGRAGSNMNNPYAHLDRSMSTSNQQSSNRGYEGQQDQYADLNRNGSHGSYSDAQYRTADYDSAAHGLNTSGRPGTAEGRSGTPDLPNVQQTYAMGDEPDHQEMERVVSPDRMVTSPQHLSQDMYAQYQQYQQNHYNEGGSPPQQPLQVRNLLPNPHNAQHQQQAQRPISGVSSQQGDDDAAYGGVW